jgi:hypothetical protein
MQEEKFPHTRGNLSSKIRGNLSSYKGSHFLIQEGIFPKKLKGNLSSFKRDTFPRTRGTFSSNKTRGNVSSRKEKPFR